MALGVINRHITKMFSDFENIFTNDKNSVSRIVRSFVSWYVVSYWLYPYRHQLTFELSRLGFAFEKADDVPVLLLHDVIEEELTGVFL